MPAVNPLAPPGREDQPYPELPNVLRGLLDNPVPYIREIELPHDLYRSELGGTPRRIAVISLNEMSPERSQMDRDFVE